MKVKKHKEQNKSGEASTSSVWKLALASYLMLLVVVWLLEYFGHAKMGFMRYMVFLNGEFAAGVLSRPMVTVWIILLLLGMGILVVNRKMNTVDRFIASLGCGLAALAINTQILTQWQSSGVIKLMLIVVAVGVVLKTFISNKE